jgi:protein SCO1
MKNYKTRVLKHLYRFGLLIFVSSIFAGTVRGDAPVTSYQTGGVVEKISPDRHVATIHNQAIPGYMMEMTMDFPVRDTNELNDVSPGDKITFTLVVGKNDDWIENVRRTGQTALTVTNAAQSTSDADPELKAGDLLPDGDLTAEDGRHIHFSDFRGQALAFTFFYTRCPLPNYCPLMNRNFAAARDLISTKSGAPTNWEFLSISFDAENDTPEALGNYAGLFRGENSSHWLFAAAPTNTLAALVPALDLMVIRDGSSISHNLRTVVVDPEGRIDRQFDGNPWTPQELADAVLKAARE